MCKTVGIVCNHRQTGKICGWLLAETIEAVKKGTSFEKFKVQYDYWRSVVKVDPSEATSTDHVVLDSFGEHILDHVRQFCPVLIEHDLHDRYVLEKLIINPRTFEMMSKEVQPAHNVVSPLAYKKYCESREEHELGQYWMTVGDFILYFAHYTMKQAFGLNVWVNVASATTAAVNSDDVRIWWDVKTPAEYDYIHGDCGGYILQVKYPLSPMNIFTTVFMRDGWAEEPDCSSEWALLDAGTMYNFAKKILNK